MYFSVICLLFLLKLRWPKDKSIITIIRTRYGEDIVNTFRSYEKNLMKFNKTGKDIWFLNECKLYDIIPKFLNIRFSNNDYYDLQLCRKFKRDLLKHELNKKYKIRRELKELFTNQLITLRNVLSTIDYYHIVNYVDFLVCRIKKC